MPDGANKDLLKKFKKNINSEVFYDDFTRGRYSTDASIYQMMPYGVLIPKTKLDIIEAINLARETKIPLLPRGGGTSQCGQTVNEAIVIDNSKYLNKVLHFDKDKMFCIVEPGIVLDELNRFLKPYGLWFPVDVSTSSRATIGGMAGNNSCGGRSIRYGMMRDNVIGVEGILYDGSTYNFENLELDKLNSSNETGSKIISKLLKLANKNQNEILTKFPKVLRRVGGYNIDALLPDAMSSRPNGKVGDGINLSHLLVGSEGTLAYSSSITLKLSILPSQKIMGICHFPSFYEAMDAAQHIVKLNPIAVELVDDTMLSLARKIDMFKPTVEAVVKGNPKSLLLVEFAEELMDDNHIQLKKLHDMMGELGFTWKGSSSKLGGVVDVIDNDLQAKVSEMRKSGLNIMMSMKDEAKPVSFVEDCAVELKDLAEYTDGLNKIFDKYETKGTWYAHASVGCLHVRPVLNMKLQNDVSKMRNIANEASELVKKFQGSFSGEHGDGIVRSEFNEVMFGKKMIDIFRTIKTSFDPDNIFNPGKIIDAPKMDSRNLFRYAPGYASENISTILNWADWPGKAGGFQGAIEMCNNNGSCRKLDGGVMCPSFRVTRDEKDSTRGRANTLRLALSGQLGEEALTSKHMSDTMSLCVSCKACKRECPTGVDMSKMKIELTNLKTQKYGLNLHDKLIAYLPDYAKIASKMPSLFNLRDKIPGVAKLSEIFLDFTSKRPLPKWRKDFFKDDELPNSIILNSNKLPVIMFVDTFSRYFEPENIRSAIKVLKAAGYYPFLPSPKVSKKPLCCGRTYLSNGLIDKAKAEGELILKTFLPYLKDGIPVVGLEPSCILSFRDELPALINDPNINLLKNNSFTFEELLSKQCDKLNFKKMNKKVLLHGHCHQKAFDAVKPIESVLGMIEGLKVETIDTSCCGMAGSFGYNKNTYDISLKMAKERLFPAIMKTKEDITVIADGTSCRCQIKDGINRESVHVARFLDKNIIY
ncbi:FAD-linked oxidase C-terminal domain-containing protein [Alphaproteobacteria bacterium]|nr:FAD-linked oxidase C-terminal domain-containing protein [Alphaproteobacteria bacterium]